MGKILADEYEAFLKEGLQAYQKAEATLKQRTWFAKGDWQTNIDFYENPRTKGVGFQLFKPNWFNDEGKGIHIETAVAEYSFRNRATDFFLHIETSKERAGFSAKDFHAELKVKASGVFDKFDDYKLYPDWPMQPLMGRFPFEMGKLDGLVVKQFSRLRDFTGSIDTIIKSFSK